ncbi:sialate O-acetylesterase [Luteimonas kalidii]|uniref:Sialate O-acetylesterase n=1 Tax=Luteimonas kalidii TaxID=3042025 RepID=A0ABT6JRZ6_9GAMM|nr:sialate O-acetylesterase [Luteimonas kalidii]MDH5832921.1 sialate O-acetylesterase [Luteimonas kalidii]
MSRARLRTRATRTLLAGVAFALAAVAAPATAADPTASLLHPMFDDHAVLQRDQPVRVYGVAPAGQTVRVEFAGKRARARASDDGRWEAQLPAFEAGGPHTLVVTAGDRSQRVSDVLVGDVWLCSGQSNMELQVWRALDARAEMAGAGNDRIRMFTVPQVSDVVPKAAFSETVEWQPVKPETVREFSAACYFFARELQKQVDVPMGLIDASWGGSRIQAWTSGEALRTLGDYDAELDVLGRYADDAVAAVGEWGTLWQDWWSARGGIDADDRPWAADEASGAWRAAPEQLGAWERWGESELAEFNGMVWYRTTVELDAAQAAQGATLVLGPADEIDMTWVNGRGVGSTYGAGAGREYALPAGLLRAGGNTIVVNVLDTYRDGGLAGPASAHLLRLADGSEVPLDGGWRYRVVPPELGTPPRAPWQSAAGLSTLYNGMIAPIGRYGLRGALWYQGESNTFEHDRYAQLLRALRSDWRNRFGADLPLLVVQLANYGAAPTAPTDSDWAALREAQRAVAAEDRNTGLAVTIDIGDRYDIHPTNKQELGRRLARVARHVVYGESLPPSGPVPASTSRNGDAVLVRFDDVSDGLLAYGAAGPIGFELCGADAGSCRYAQAELAGDRVTLRASGAGDATRVRYCWADSPVCTLFDGAGLPAGPFELPVTP